MPKEITKAVIRFYQQDVIVNLKHRKKLKSFIENLFKEEHKTLSELTYIFCNDDYLLRINQNFLQHDDLTDIITFDLSPGEQIVGEIYISVDRIKENSMSNSVTISNELHRVVFHGALHLCGYTDKSPIDKSIMTSKEDKYLNSYF